MQSITSSVISSSIRFPKNGSSQRSFLMSSWCVTFSEVSAIQRTSASFHERRGLIPSRCCSHSDATDRMRGSGYQSFRRRGDECSQVSQVHARCLAPICINSQENYALDTRLHPCISSANVCQFGRIDPCHCPARPRRRVLLRGPPDEIENTKAMAPHWFYAGSYF